MSSSPSSADAATSSSTARRERIPDKCPTCGHRATRVYYTRMADLSPRAAAERRRQKNESARRRRERSRLAAARVSAAASGAPLPE